MKGTLSVLSKTYTIDPVAPMDEKSYLGRSNRDFGLIQIHPGITAQEQEETLLHEVIHIVDQSLKLDLSEEQVIRLSVGLYTAGLKVPYEAAE